MKLTLLRHAQTEGSLRNLYYGAADIPALPESLSELHRRAGDYPTAQRYYTSGMLRTEQTLAYLWRVPHTGFEPAGDGLRRLQMKSYEAEGHPAYQAWITDVEHNPCPHGESAPQVLRRSLAAIAPVVQRPEDAVCVIHGGVTAGLMMAWFGGGRYDYSVSPGQGFQVTFREGQPVSYTRIPAAE
ncbi:MAG: histidine phosphatase family protein [Oscillospiraceae bacterium]